MRALHTVAFRLRRSAKHIATLDSSGIALAGVQALVEENGRLSKDNLGLLKFLETLESQQAQMQALVARLLERDQTAADTLRTAMN